MKLRTTLLGSTLLVVAVSSSALSLGRSRGAAVLGQPLNVQFDVRLDQAEEAGSQCFAAEVFLGDNPVDVGRVQVTVQNAAASLAARVRVRTFSNVNEPVVSVILRSQCGQNASRRYDFLTDFPVEMRSASVPTVIPATTVATPTAATLAPPLVHSNIQSSQASEVAPPSPAVRAAPAPAPVRRLPPVVVNKPKPSAVATAPAAAPAPKAKPARGRSRLQLDVAPTPDNRQVALKPSMEMLSAPSDGGPQRADAAAAWRALNLQPAENPEDKARLLFLEAEAKALKAQLAKRNEEFQARLDRLENSRYDSNVVYLLIGLLLAALAAVAYWWNRARKTSASVADWVRHDASDLAESSLSNRSVSTVDLPLPMDEDKPAAATPVPAVAPPRAEPPARPAKPILTDALPEVIENSSVFRDSVFDDLQALSIMTAPKATLGAAPARPTGGARSAVTDDFQDVRQHAEFFVSLGQYDQAIELLKKSIDESIELNPLAYLELLGIYQQLGRQGEYDRLRDNFNRVFNGKVPEFSSFRDEGHSLENYPSAMLKIEKSWGNATGLEVLEELLFRAHGNAGTPQFDLAAYRDLLMLYAIAKGDDPRRAERPAALLANSTISAKPNVPVVPMAAVEPAELVPELDLSMHALNQPVPMPTLGENSHTQPILLMSEMAKIDDADASQKPAPSKSNEPLDLDLDLNLDFTNSELQALRSAEQNTDLDLPILEDVPVRLPPAGAADADTGSPSFPSVNPVDSHLIEFDLFDPNIEAKISPKAPKGPG